MRRAKRSGPEARDQEKRAQPSASRLVRVLGAILALEAALLAWRPVSRSTWVLENVLAVALVLVLALTYRRFRLSRVSYICIFVFLFFHQIGAHYTYSQVPYDAFFERLLGWSPDATFGFERNHFDRFVHFAYGFLLVYPIREVFLRIADVRGFWSYFLPLDVAMSTSLVYELLEWAAAVVFGGETGQAYLGTQGDVWDAHKDMALAALGAALAMGCVACVHALVHRDFVREIADSLRVKHARPLDE